MNLLKYLFKQKSNPPKRKVKTGEHILARFLKEGEIIEISECAGWWNDEENPPKTERFVLINGELKPVL